YTTLFRSAHGNAARISFSVPRPFLVWHRRRDLRHTKRAVRAMIPTMRSLGSAVDGVLKSVPEGVTRGEITAGLYGLGFLGRWALPILKERGVRLVSGYD